MRESDYTDADLFAIQLFAFITLLVALGALIWSALLDKRVNDLEIAVQSLQHQQAPITGAQGGQK